MWPHACAERPSRSGLGRVAVTPSHVVLQRRLRAYAHSARQKSHSTIAVVLRSLRVNRRGVSMASEIAFPADFHAARAQFSAGLDSFEALTGRAFTRTRFVMDEAEDLSIDIAEFVPTNPRRVYIAVAGVHGIEGYAGNAIERALLADVLPRLDPETTGVVLVHALNPVGMHRLRRVNANNVDLNRNFAAAGSPLYSTDSQDFARLRALLEPQGRYAGGIAGNLRFLGMLGMAVVRSGMAALRQVTLAGQYVAPMAIFYGGNEPERETLCMQRLFESLCGRYQEVLLTDLHTGYGTRAQASLLFGALDSSELHGIASEGLRDAFGRDQGYTAHGDLVGYCHATAKRMRPDGVFNGVVLELGTHGLGTIEQVDDLHTVVRENQVQHFGARDAYAETIVRRNFRELFYPGDPLWQRQSLTAALQRIEQLLTARGFLTPG